MAKAKKELGYRPCVGVMLLNREGMVWIGRRADMPNPEGDGQWWQMPQGGIDKGEDPRQTALRELAEETSIRSATIIAEAPEWYRYELPEQLIGKSWGGRYRGQTQKWFAARFTGDDGEIDLNPPGHKAEFDQWRWARMDEMLDLVVPFKRAVYEKVIAAFRYLEA
jgi:putative (di)nucleoside polyphosphate hydrolase